MAGAGGGGGLSLGLEWPYLLDKPCWRSHAWTVERRPPLSPESDPSPTGPWTQGGVPLGRVSLRAWCTCIAQGASGSTGVSRTLSRLAPAVWPVLVPGVAGCCVVSGAAGDTGTHKRALRSPHLLHSCSKSVDGRVSQGGCRNAPRTAPRTSEDATLHCNVHPFGR